MRWSIEQINRLLLEVERHKRHCQIIIDYDGGGNFQCRCDKIEILPEEYTMFGDRKEG